MAHDRCGPYQGSSARERRCWREPEYGAHKRGLNTKIHLVVDAHGMPVGFLITENIVADCMQACALIEGIPAEHLLADRGYDSNEIIEKALAGHCGALCQA